MNPVDGAGDVSSWTEPGVFEVAPGVHRIPLPMPEDGLRAVNVYAIEDAGRLVLIDGGWAVPEARSSLDRALATLGVDVRAISRILVTHAHRDHYTLAVLLRREFGTRVGLGAGERPAIEALTARVGRFAAQVALLHRAGAGALAQRVAAGDSRVDPLPEGWDLPDDWLEAGHLDLSDRSLAVVPTPGHTRGHLVFHDEDASVLFAGDHVLPHITPSIGFESVPAPSPLRDYLDSLRVVRTLPDARLLPAHGSELPSTHERVDQLVTHHDQRLTETGAAVGTLGAATAAEVAAVLGWTRRRRSFHELDPFNQMLAVTETVAHLAVLVESGALTVTGRDVEVYSAASTAN
jgi:glyoxylase-like metal-dependent hydrolase (beta-lactamase superfamily II)